MIPVWWLESTRIGLVSLPVADESLEIRIIGSELDGVVADELTDCRIEHGFAPECSYWFADSLPLTFL